MYSTLLGLFSLFWFVYFDTLAVEAEVNFVFGFEALLVDFRS